jgi:hypothetical protein
VVESDDSSAEGAMVGNADCEVGSKLGRHIGSEEVTVVGFRDGMLVSVVGADGLMVASADDAIFDDSVTA